jgi:glutaredoxin
MRVAALIAGLVLNTTAACPALAVDPFGIAERGLGNMRPPATESAVRSLAEVIVMNVPAGTYTDDAAAGDLILYTRPGCRYCVRAIQHLRSRGAPFVERNVQGNPVAHAEFRQLGGRGVPLLVAGDQVVHGFSAPQYDRVIARVNVPMPAARSVTPTPHFHAPAGTYRAGDRLLPTRGPLQLLGIPQRGGAPVRTLARGTPVIFIGPSRNGYLYVSAGQLEGWADARSLSPLQ